MSADPMGGGLATATVSLGSKKFDLLVPDDEGIRFIFKEIVEREPYKHVPRVPQPRAVLDIGANVGLAAAYFRLTYPDASIDCVEPDSTALTYLQKNAERFGKCRVHAVGLYDRDCEKTFYSASQTVISSLSKNPYAHARPIRLQLRHAGAFVTGLGIDRFDVIKIDTEGAEVPIVRALAGAIRGAAIVHIEFHSREDRRTIDELMNPSHCLCRGTIESAHRGQLTYVANSLVSYEAHEAPLLPEDEDFRTTTVTQV